jgi:hypothetical protein
MNNWALRFLRRARLFAVRGTLLQSLTQTTTNIK